MTCILSTIYRDLNQCDCNVGVEVAFCRFCDLYITVLGLFSQVVYVLAQGKLAFRCGCCKVYLT
jgi:hypothetical protein